MVANYQTIPKMPSSSTIPMQEKCKVQYTAKAFLQLLIIIVPQFHHHQIIYLTFRCIMFFVQLLNFVFKCSLKELYIVLCSFIT